MTPDQYDAWYDTPRGRWIGSSEWALLRSTLELRAGDSVLDVGCGTGRFTRRAAAEGARVVGMDLDESALEFARQRSPAQLEFLSGDATCLPFEDRSFDKVMSVTALCFVQQWPRAIAEIVRVSRGRFALGLLNRNSLLWLQKGRGEGLGAYRGAHWHTTDEIAAVLGSLPVTDVRHSFGIFLPEGGAVARMTERASPRRCHWDPSWPSPEHLITPDAERLCESRMSDERGVETGPWSGSDWLIRRISALRATPFRASWMQPLSCALVWFAGLLRTTGSKVDLSFHQKIATGALGSIRTARRVEHQSIRVLQIKRLLTSETARSRTRPSTVSDVRQLLAVLPTRNRGYLT